MANNSSEVMETRVAIMKFEDRNRYGQNGVPTNILFGGGKKCIVVCKSPHKRNFWAKIKISSAFFEGDESQRGELVELWGPVGEYTNELKAYQWHFGVLPCKYPSEAEWKLEAIDAMAKPSPPGLSVDKEDGEGSLQKRGDYRHLAEFTFSIDNAETKDVDDALSVEFVEDKVRLGIHISDVASRIPISSPLFEWAKSRVSSAYHGGVEEDDGGSVPMLPPQLAHGELSLNQGVERNAITLWLEYDGTGKLISEPTHERTLIVNGCKTSYSDFGKSKHVFTSKARDFLEKVSGETAPEDMVAWSMITYNKCLADLLVHRPLKDKHIVAGILKVQKDNTQPSEYKAVTQKVVSGGLVDCGHASLKLPLYTHATSPIRRFVDMVNQHALYDTLFKWGVDNDKSLGKVMDTLNASVKRIARYHATVDAMELAYITRQKPLLFSGKVELGGDGDSSAYLLVYTERRRMKVPLHDSYFADPITDLLSNDFDGVLEMHGVLLGGRQRLRVRVQSVVSEQRESNRGEKFANPTHADVRKAAEEPVKEEPAKEVTEVVTEAVAEAVEVVDKLQAAELTVDDEWCCAECTFVNSALVSVCGVCETPQEGSQSVESARSDEDDIPLDSLSLSSVAPEFALDSTILTEEKVNQVLGYPIDTFQVKCLEVIVQPEKDLLAMAPTGSGKTAVALMAILQAFARGKKAVYTSPIKALSNQKFAEFKEWFKGRGVKAEVSLLTGDVKIRAPPGTQNELLICTSEILRNKLVKASGEKSSQFFPPPPNSMTNTLTENSVDVDLERLGCVVSDEIHYINDVDRGSVWEETLMHLPPDVQMVALSATLREPEKFVKWIETTRKRAGELVRRTDRHVPLHLGGVSGISNDFVEFFSTHGPKAQVFDNNKFNKLYSEKGDDAVMLAKKQAASSSKNSREAEKAAVAATRRGTGSGGGSGGCKGKGGGKGKGGKGGGGGGGDGINFQHECTLLAKQLNELDQLPAIVFCMSRRKCVEGAKAIKGLNLLFNSKPKPRPDQDDDLPAFLVWQEEEKERSDKARAAERLRKSMHQRHLEPYMKELKDLEAYTEINELLKRGLAYHHAGMLPILREYVELCFQARLVKVVFATETLAVGVNMPARTVVFTQVDKVQESGNGHRWLRPDEFWQMAGRAGRRGMDVKGYVVYSPTLSVAGLKNKASILDLRGMVSGTMPSAKSQLVVDKTFVLRHLARGHGKEVMDLTLLADEFKRNNATNESRLCAMAAEDGGSALDDDTLLSMITEYDEIENKLNGGGGDLGFKIRLQKKDEKKLTGRKRAILDLFTDEKHFADMRIRFHERRKLKSEIKYNVEELNHRWYESIDWMTLKGFISADDTQPSGYKLLPRGQACAAFADGYPLVLGTVIADGYLEKLTFAEICAWLSLFLRGTAVNDRTKEGLIFPTVSGQLEEACKFSDYLLNQLSCELRVDTDGAAYTKAEFIGEYGEGQGVAKWDRSPVKQYGATCDPLGRELMLLVLDWVERKDLSRIAQWIDPSLLGTFVKAIMRIVSYVDLVKEVALGLGQFEVHNKLDGHLDKLLGGLVTNASLYLAMQ